MTWERLQRKKRFFERSFSASQLELHALEVYLIFL